MSYFRLWDPPFLGLFQRSNWGEKRERERERVTLGLVLVAQPRLAKSLLMRQPAGPFEIWGLETTPIISPRT